MEAIQGYARIPPCLYPPGNSHLTPQFSLEPTHLLKVVGSPEEAADRPYAFVVCTFKCLPDVFPTDNLISPLLKTDTLPTVVLIQYAPPLSPL